MTAKTPRQAAVALIAATNAFDVDSALTLVTPDAVIDDPSTGHRFLGHAGVREYVERYFIGCHTVSKILGLRVVSGECLRMRVDFTGDFGHEVGLLKLAFGGDGRIVQMDADLE
ncbi:nuclear transport factor 2 family protein [Rhizobium terricola]|uniref:nuclear transport factor 2 family protein n=1 Tax=Rhizobium terricola TaxID=2728849 RepID=UPI00197CC4C1|nr:nuclear transport factor 2 family protein [Rhizobium terricola]